MQFVLVTEFLTRPHPIPNPNPQVWSHSDRQGWNVVHIIGCEDGVGVGDIVRQLMRLARLRALTRRGLVVDGDMRSSQDLSADKVVHALWVRWCITSLPATRDLCSSSRCDRQTDDFEPGRGEETNSTLTGTFAG